MISKDFLNLMMAGRCVSSDRETNSALRVKASCMAMGQAAGVTVSTALKEKKALKDIRVSLVKEILFKQGAIVPGLSEGVEFTDIFPS